jgi:hypothetical protein
MLHRHIFNRLLWEAQMRVAFSNPRSRWIISTSCALLAGTLPGLAFAFTPPDSGNLLVWLDAGAGVTASGGSVSAWADQSGNGNNAAQATAGDQPTLVASSAGFNGQPVLSFNGSSDYLQAPLPVNTVGGLTVFIVAQHDSVSANRAILGGSAGNYGGSSQWFLMQSTASSNFAEINRNGSVNTSVTSGTLDTAAHVYAMTYNGGAETLTQTIDGSSSSSPAIFGNVSYTTLDIGALVHFGSPFDYGDVNIAEILVYDEALSSTDAAIVENYLSSKYVAAVPEPGCLGLMAIAAGIAMRRRRMDG